MWEVTRVNGFGRLKEAPKPRHEVIVAKVCELRAISHSGRKSDGGDADKLARYARLDPSILKANYSPLRCEQQKL